MHYHDRLDCFATYAVLGKRVAGRYDALTMVAFNHFAGAIIILPVALRQARELGPFSSGARFHGRRAAVLFMRCAVRAGVSFIFWLLRYLKLPVERVHYLLPVLAVILGICSWANAAR